MKYIKIYGLMRTGTCYLNRLICLNFDALPVSNNLQWKHSYPLCPDLRKITPSPIETAFNRNEIKYILSIKNPYSWIISMCKRRNWNLETLTDDFLLELVFKWSYFSKEYLRFDNSKKYDSYICKYEDLIESFDSTMTVMSKTLNLTAKKEIFENIKNEVSSSAKLLPNVKDWTLILNQSLSKINQHQIEIIAKSIDKEMMNKFEYNIVPF
jgi:hypothetical protein